MAQFNAVINQVASPAGYCYILFKDGVGLKDANGLVSVTAALNAVRDDIAANLGGETVKRTTINVTSS